jgi:hypothetical protein
MDRIAHLALAAVLIAWVIIGDWGTGTVYRIAAV